MTVKDKLKCTKLALLKLGSYLQHVQTRCLKFCILGRNYINVKFNNKRWDPKIATVCEWYDAIIDNANDRWNMTIQ